MIIFFTSPIGLGHATRDIAISEKLGFFTREKILFITGQAAYNIISNKGYLAYDVYKPDKFNVDNLMQLRSPLKWILQYIQYYRKCKVIAGEFIEKNNKNNGLIISDEDFASIAIGEKRKRKRILITDLIETHFVKGSFFSLIESSMNRSMQNMIKRCDHVIIPDYGKNNDNISYVGPIVRELSTTNRVMLRKRFGMDKQTILVSIGGTEAGKYLIEMAIKAYEKLKRRIDIDMIIASGPSSLDICGNNNYYTNYKSFRNIGFVFNLHEYVYAADLIISLAGRSTIDESLVYGTPGIFIPIKNHFEQEENARKLGFKYDDIFRLESLIEEKIGTTRYNRDNIKNGVEKAAKIILEMIG
jgi:UDP-N-acetylglucosamine--N-acetylmuramyl-(pentapeptide) pyrophosphoryl-undecaprenol N-acetylglucosamine transferase